MIRELKTARDLLARVGWVGPRHEPFCVVRGPGVKLNPAHPALATDGAAEHSADMWMPTKWFHTFNAEHQGLLRYSVRGACEVADADFERLEDAAGNVLLQEWLQDPKRTVDDVLRLFVRAIERSKKRGG